MIIRRYSMVFADGKSATVLDPANEPPETLIPALIAIFASGYVLRVDPL